MADSVVKVDSELLKKIEDFVKKNKFAYSSKKQVVNLAIIEFLNSKSSQKKRTFGSSKKPSFDGFLNDKSLKNTKKRGEKQ